MSSYVCIEHCNLVTTKKRAKENINFYHRKRFLFKGKVSAGVGG